MNSYLKGAVELIAAIWFTFWIFGGIARKAGYSRWLGLWMLLPLANIVVLVWFAYTEWPIENALVRIGHGEPESITTNEIWREPM